jgi:hypothetical protein
MYFTAYCGPFVLFATTIVYIVYDYKNNYTEINMDVKKKNKCKEKCKEKYM